jgi:hypothetical protein
VSRPETRDERISRLLDEIVNPPPEKDPSPGELARSILETSGSVQPATIGAGELARILDADPEDLSAFELGIRLQANG